MINGKRVLIIIPALNESGSIADVVGEVRGELPGVDVLVVDDGSTDRTAAVAAAAGALVARLPYNLGVGGAMRARLPVRPRPRLRRGDPDRRRRPARPALRAEAGRRCSTTTDLVIGARFAGEGDYTVTRPPPLGDGHAVRRALPGGQDQAHRHHLRLPGRQPAGHRAVRPLVPGGVPRRHGRDAGAHRPPRLPDPPGAGGHAHADGRHAQPLPRQGDDLPRPGLRRLSWRSSAGDRGDCSDLWSRPAPSLSAAGWPCSGSPPTCTSRSPGTPRPGRLLVAVGALVDRVHPRHRRVHAVEQEVARVVAARRSQGLPPGPVLARGATVAAAVLALLVVVAARRPPAARRPALRRRRARWSPC